MVLIMGGKYRNQTYQEKKADPYKNISIFLSGEEVEYLNLLATEGIIPSRSDFIRKAVEDFKQKEEAFTKLFRAERLKLIKSVQPKPLQTLTVNFNQNLLKRLELFKTTYCSRDEIVRHAVRNYLEQWIQPKVKSPQPVPQPVISPTTVSIPEGKTFRIVKK